ncbi:MAG: YdcF family protein, partial [Candidatus Nanopelagicales bacterium]
MVALAWVGSVAFRVWWVARGDDRTPVDVVFVLGASQYDGEPSPVFAGRLDHAVRLYEEGVAPEVVTVGSNMPGDRFTE